MTPAEHGVTLSDVFRCIACSQLFDNKRAPVNLICGHVLCLQCIPKVNNRCPEDEVEGSYPIASYPINVALLSIITDDIIDCLPFWEMEKVPKGVLSSVESTLVAMAHYLHRLPSEKGGTLLSEILSRTLQRKLVSLLCFQIVEEEGRLRFLKTSRLIAERILMELLLNQQNSGNLSTHLWTAVRARGCQFLGPVMQEDVLKLILVALDKGALIARKTLVMFVVQMLSEDYPQVSKTCIGHVVQLLYRASCFNVLKRDGESSLMQLKDEFRNYDSLRKEHDTQIVQMALECGLRISPDQWSVLLYGDQAHRSHMQSIINRMQTPQSYIQGVNELSAVANGEDSTAAACDLSQIAQLLRLFDPLSSYHELVVWDRFAECIDTLHKLIKSYVEFMMKRNGQRTKDMQRTISLRRPLLNSSRFDRTCTYKTKMCKDISSRRFCPRGSRCSYAHNVEELREGFRKNVPSSDQLSQTQCFLPVPSTTYPTVFLFALPGYHSDPLLTSVPSPSHSHPAVLPVLPVPLVISSPAHCSISLSNLENSQVFMLQPGIPRQSMILGNTTSYQRSSNAYHSSQLSSIWNTCTPYFPGAMLIHHMNTPNQPQQRFWMHTPPAIYTLDAASDTNLIWSGPSRPELAIPHPVQLSRMGGSTFDSEQLMMKRNEIINRLAPLTLLDDDDLEDGVGHVSYTVASSVLDDRGELHPVTVVASPQTRGLPHISTTNLSSVQMSATTAEGPINVTVESSLSKSCHRAPGVTLMQLTSAVTARETSLLSSESPPLATVQSDCSIMQVKDSLNQSLPTPAVQRSQAPLPLCAVPLVFDSNIIRERIGVSSTGINQQLVAELRIPQREMNRLDQTLVHSEVLGLDDTR